MGNSSCPTSVMLQEVSVDFAKADGKLQLFSLSYCLGSFMFAPDILGSGIFLVFIQRT